MSVKEGICNTVKPKHASVHIWQAAMHVKAYLPEREREIAEEEKKEKNTFGAISPGNALPAIQCVCAKKPNVNIYAVYMHACVF